MATNKASPAFLYGIARLRESIDFDPFLPGAEAPIWMRRLAFVAKKNLGTLALLGPAGLKVDDGSGHRERFYPDPAVLYLAALSDALRSTSRHVAFSIPPAAKHLPLIVAATSVLSNTLERSKGVKRSGNVLIISRDLDLRSRYCDLFVNAELLDDVHPGSRMRPNGERVLLRPRQAQPLATDGGVCFFLPERMMPKSINFSPALVILDLRYSRWISRTEPLISWLATALPTCAVAALYTLGDQDSLSMLAKAGFTDLPLDHSAISSCCEKVVKPLPSKSGTIEASLARSTSFLERRHTITEINGAGQIERSFEQTGNLLYKQQNFDSREFRRAKWILSTLMQMPVPLTWFEMTAQSLGRSSIKRLIELLEPHGDAERHSGPILQSIRMALQQLYLELSKTNPRATALATVLEKAVRATEGPLITIVRDRVSKAALESWLSMQAFPGSEWTERLDIRHCAEFPLDGNTERQLCVLNGALPRRYRWIAGADLAKRVLAITYPHETAVVEGQMLSFYDEAILAERRRERTFSTSVLIPDWVGAVHDGPESKIPEFALNRPPRRKTYALAQMDDEPIRAGGLADLKSVLDASRQQAEAGAKRAQMWDADSLETEESSEQSDLLFDADESIAVILITVESRLHGHGMISLRAGALQEFIRPSAGEEILRGLSEKLRIGDVLLRMEDSSSRESLFDQLVRLAEGQPEMDYLQAFRSEWRSAMFKLRVKFQSRDGIDISEAYRAVKRAGAPVEAEQTVRLWLQDQVIGPDAIESIQAVGEVSGITTLSRQARQFDKAFRKIRGIHQGIGRRLSASVRLSFAHLHFGQTASTKDRLEDRLGLPLEELIESVDLAEVLSVEGPKTASLRTLGQFIPST